MERCIQKVTDEIARFQPDLIHGQSHGSGVLVYLIARNNQIAVARMYLMLWNNQIGGSGTALQSSLHQVDTEFYLNLPNRAPAWCILKCQALSL